MAYNDFRRRVQGRNGQQDFGRDSDEDEAKRRQWERDEREYARARGEALFGTAGHGYESSDAFSLEDRYRRQQFEENERARGYGSPGRWMEGEQPRRIDPKGYVRTDERIRENVCEALSRSGVDVSGVSVQVREGHVTLEGSVSDRRMKHHIENLADDCGGVKDITNHIDVTRAHMGRTA